MKNFALLLLLFCATFFIGCKGDEDPITITIPDLTIAVDENPNNGQTLGTMSGTASAGTVTFAIVSQTPTGAIAINASSGDLTVADVTLFDYEANPSMTVVVSASSGAISEEATVNITLNNLLEVLTTQDENLTIDENPSNGQVLIAVSATTDLNSPSFAIVNESVSGAFAIDATSGELTVEDESLFDFEQRTSLTVTVNLSNGSLMATSIVTVTLTDVFEIAWTQVSASAAFGERYGHGFVSFNNRLWVIGGIRGTTRTNEIWSSIDGTNWQQEQTTGNVFPPINNFATLVYDNKIWVVAGFTDNGRTNNIWSSPDGITWTQVGSQSRFSIRSNTPIAYYNGKAWVLGGLNHSGLPANDTFYSGDIATWEPLGPANISGGIAGHQMLVFNDKLWIIAGTTINSQQLHEQHNKIWSSTDGLNWTEQTINGTHFSVRWLHRAVVYNNKIWVIGGESNGVRNNEVWSSSDGVNWTKEQNNPFAERDNFGLVEFNGKIWMSGGSNGNGVLSDVWSSN